MRAIALLLLVLTHTPPAGASAHTDLPNPGFEHSIGDGGRLTPPPVPLHPDGWTIEGTAAHFEYAIAEPHTGARAIAIVGPASTNDVVCAEGLCVHNPINLARDTARRVVATTPHWRTLEPVPVHPGLAYRLSATVRLQDVFPGEGAVLAVRWYDGALPLAYDVAATSLGGAAPAGWHRVDGYVPSPARASHAVVMLGHTDDLWIGRVGFDDAWFGPA